MKLYFLIVALLFRFISFGQVKSYNLLGKTWYVHGIDLRLKSQSMPADFFIQIIQNASISSNEKQEVLDFFGSFESLGGGSAYAIDIEQVSAGIVLRPFYSNRLKFLKEIEIGHNFDFEYSSNRIDARKDFVRSDLLMQSAMFGYSIKPTISSPALAESIKLYAFGEAFIHLPIFCNIYSQLKPIILPLEPGNYRKLGEDYNYRITSHFLNYAYGGGLGLKINASCKLNFHLEGSIFNLHTYHYHNQRNFTANPIMLQFGFRYKYAGDENQENSSEKGVFW